MDTGYSWDVIRETTEGAHKEGQVSVRVYTTEDTEAVIIAVTGIYTHRDTQNTEDKLINVILTTTPDTREIEEFFE